MSRSTALEQPDALAEFLPIPVKEADRRRSRREAVAHLLSDRRWHSTDAVLEVGGSSFRARISELRDTGWDIKAEHVREGTWQYRAITVGGTKRVTHALGNQALYVMYRTLAAGSDLDEDLAERLLERLPKAWGEELFAEDGVQRLKAARGNQRC
jgi:hypothetical protein